MWVKSLNLDNFDGRIVLMSIVKIIIIFFCAKFVGGQEFFLFLILAGSRIFFGFQKLFRFFDDRWRDNVAVVVKEDVPIFRRTIFESIQIEAATLLDCIFGSKNNN